MPPKKRIRLSAEESKDRIVAAAIELISEKGYLGTSFQMIADRCKVSQSAVIHHFRNREELVEGVLKQLLKHNHELVAGSMKPEDGARTRLMKHFAGNLNWATKYEHEGQMLLFLYYSASYDERFSRFYNEMLKNARNRIREHLLAGIREGVFPKKLDTVQAAEQLHDALLGSFVNYVAVRKAGIKAKLPLAKWERLIALYEGKI